MKFLRSKCPIIIKIYLWYYRLLQTFGGLIIDSNGKLATNKYLKYYGYIVAIFITASNILGHYLVLQSKLIVSLYNSGYVLTYYFFITLCVINKIRVFANLWFLQFNGIKFFEIFYHYKVERRKNLYILFTLWILHILISIIVGTYYLFLPHELTPYTMKSFIFISDLCNFSIAWSVSFLMWNISVHAFENLVKVKHILIENIEEISGNNHLDFLYFLNLKNIIRINIYFFIKSHLKT
jgi:hypothetical protein